MTHCASSSRCVITQCTGNAVGVRKPGPQARSSGTRDLGTAVRQDPSRRAVPDRATEAPEPGVGLGTCDEFLAERVAWGHARAVPVAPLEHKSARGAAHGLARRYPVRWQSHPRGRPRPSAAAITVSRVGASVVTEAELISLFGRQPDEPTVGYIDTITFGDGVVPVPPNGQPHHFGNHRCDPSPWWVDAFRLSARRDIAVGEELTKDYRASSGEPSFRMECRRGSELCRPVSTGNDWKIPELRAC